MPAAGRGAGLGQFEGPPPLLDQGPRIDQVSSRQPSPPACAPRAGTPGWCSRPAGPGKTAKGRRPHPGRSARGQSAGQAGTMQARLQENFSGTRHTITMSFYSHAVFHSTSVPGPARSRAGMMSKHGSSAGRGQAAAGRSGSGSREPRPADVARWRKLAAPEAVAAAIRLAACRDGAGPSSPVLFGCGSTPSASSNPPRRSSPVTRRSRFDPGAACGRPVLGDRRRRPCPGRTGKVLAVDGDAGMCRRLAWNAGVYEVAGRVLAVPVSRRDFFPSPGSLGSTLIPTAGRHGTSVREALPIMLRA